jgi:hypothetical protein
LRPSGDTSTDIHVPSLVLKVTVLASGLGVLIRLPTSSGFGG